MVFARQIGGVAPAQRDVERTLELGNAAERRLTSGDY